MKKIAIATLALGALVSSLTTTAHAAPTADDRRCGFASNTDPVGEAGQQTGVINGGPLVLGEEGRLVCTIQVGSANKAHSAPDATAPVSSDPGLVAVIAPTPISYIAQLTDDVYLCSEVVYTNGTHLYWNAATSTWSSSSAAECNLAISAQTPGEEDPTLGPIWALIDGIVCPVLITIFGADGDVLNVYDCPPYGA